MSRVIPSLQPFPATPADLEDLLELETRVFPPERRESRRGLARSLGSDFQEVWVLRPRGEIAASLTLRKHQKSMRIYSLAVEGDCRGMGLGDLLMAHACGRARELQLGTLRLEADADNARLIGWYRRLGFHFEKELPDYYGPGTRAWRMKKILSTPEH